MEASIQARRTPVWVTGRPTLELLWLAAPMVAMTSSRMLMGFIDFAYVSKLGTDAQAAISPSALMLFVIACVGMGMSQGVQTLVSQSDGRGEPQRAGEYVWQTFYVAIIAAIVSAPIAWMTPSWFPLIGAISREPPVVEQMEIRFLSYGLWSIGPMTLCAGLESFYNGIRRPLICLIGVLGALATIALGNWVFIFGNLGMPAMGIAGSGLATLLAWSVRTVILIVPLASESIDKRYHTRRSMSLSPGKLWEVVRLGGPVAMQWLVDIGAWFVFLQMMMPPYGRNAMAGANLCLQYTHLSFMPALGLGIALTTQVGNAIGAGNHDQAMMRVRVARRAIMAYMGVMAVVFILGGRSLAAVFCNEADPAEAEVVIANAAAMLVWAGLFQVFDGMCITYSFASRGAGDTRVPAVLFAICCWVIFVGGGYTMTWAAPDIGFHGPWMMCMSYIIVLALLLMRRFNSGAWRKIRLFDRRGESTDDTAAPTPAAAVESAVVSV